METVTELLLFCTCCRIIKEFSSHFEFIIFLFPFRFSVSSKITQKIRLISRLASSLYKSSLP